MGQDMDRLFLDSASGFATNLAADIAFSVRLTNRVFPSQCLLTCKCSLIKMGTPLTNGAACPAKR